MCYVTKNLQVICQANWEGCPIACLNKYSFIVTWVRVKRFLNSSWEHGKVQRASLQLEVFSSLASVQDFIMCASWHYRSHIPFRQPSLGLGVYLLVGLSVLGRANSGKRPEQTVEAGGKFWGPSQDEGTYAADGTLSRVGAMVRSMARERPMHGPLGLRPRTGVPVA